MVSSMSTKECNNITFFLLNRISYEEAQMMAAEAVMTPTAHSHQSFSLDDCLPVLLPKYFLISTLKQILKCRHTISCTDKNVTTPLTLHRWSKISVHQLFTAQLQTQVIALKKKNSLGLCNIFLLKNLAFKSIVSKSSSSGVLNNDSEFMPSFSYWVRS